MAEYQIRWGNNRKYAGSSLPKARLMAIKVLEEQKFTSYVGIFEHTNEMNATKYGRVGRTNTVYYTWEVPTKGWGYNIENFLNSEGKIVRPAQWFFHFYSFYY